MKYVTYIWNIIKSYFYDAYIWLFDDLKLRAQADNLNIHRSRRLYPGYLQRGAAMEGIRYLAYKYCKGHGVDIGSGAWPLNDARPIENSWDENAYNLKENNASLDYVFTSHLLEHLERPYEAINEWARALKPGGILFLYLPHPSCSMWQPENLPAHLWMPDPLVVSEYFNSSELYDLEDVSYTPDGMLSYYVIARRR